MGQCGAHEERRGDRLRTLPLPRQGRPRSVSPPASSHFDGRRFHNPTGANGRPFWMVPRMLLTPRRRWPATVPVEPRRPPSAGAGDVVVTFIGHATFLIQVGTTSLLTDPVYSERASPVSFAGPRRVRAPGVRFDDLPAIALVLLSHNHYDHCDLRTLRALERRFQPRFVTPLGNGRLLRSAGIHNVEEFDWWQSTSTAPLPVTLTPAQHFSARGPLDRDRKSTRLNSSHRCISYAVFCLKKKKNIENRFRKHAQKTDIEYS